MKGNWSALSAFRFLRAAFGNSCNSLSRGTLSSYLCSGGKFLSYPRRRYISMMKEYLG